MRYPVPLIPATLVRRYKRFLATWRATGREVTAHWQTGRHDRSRCSRARACGCRNRQPKRKLAYSWELIEVDFGGGTELVGVNTAHPNVLVAEALAAGAIPELAGYARPARGEIRQEFARRLRCWSAGAAALLCRDQERPPDAPARTRPNFPDSVTARGAKHLDELGRHGGGRRPRRDAFLIQIGSARRFKLARDIDPAYGRAFERRAPFWRRNPRLSLRIARGGIVLAETCRLLSRPALSPGGPPRCGRRGPGLRRRALLKLRRGESECRAGGGAAAMLDELRRRGTRAATQDRTDQASRPGCL